MGHVPPTYSPRYNDVVRVYSVNDPADPMSSTPNVVSARAARSVAPWDKVIQSLYLMPLAVFHSDSIGSSERVGVTDTYDSGTTSPVSLTLVDRPKLYI